MVEKWIRAWPDAGRVLMRLIEFVSTNNGIERGHRTMTKVACGDMILKVSLATRAGAALTEADAAWRLVLRSV